MNNNRPLFMSFDLEAFTESDYKKAVTDGPLYEDEIYGVIEIEHGDTYYIADVHYQTYSGRKGFALEVYTTIEGGGRGDNIGCIETLRKNKDYYRFCRRAEKLLMEFITDYEVSIEMYQ